MSDGAANYPCLFSPLTIGNVTVRNRLMQTGHATMYAQRGVETKRAYHYQVERAKGGIGLIIAGNRLIHPSSAVARLPLGFIRDAVKSDRRLTNAVHERGAAIFAQTNHFGLNAAVPHPEDYRVTWGPSAVRSVLSGDLPKEMEPEDIAVVIDSWARTAELAREAGFDGVEVHLAHGYLLHEFLSPLYNKRSDDYGGSFENRLRLACEVIRAVRSRVGSDYVVGVRLSLTDLLDGGLDVDDAIQVASVLEDSGDVDFIDTTASGSHLFHMIIPPSDVPDGWLLEMAAKVKKSLSRLPLFVVGGLRDPQQAEMLLSKGEADMIAMTRTQIADPEYANKVKEGREDEIYHCIRGNQGCLSNSGFRGYAMLCTVNPATGREEKFGSGTLVGTTSPGRWTVVGGGPAGMKAAEILSKRGHAVTLLEKEDRLGGQVNLILKTPGREPFEWLIRDLEAQMRKHGVDVRLGSEASTESVLESKPDGVIVATGAVPSRTGFSAVALTAAELPGADAEHVLTVWDVLEGANDVGRRVVVLDDEGSRMAAGAAEVLLDQGRDVEVITPFASLFPETAATLDQPILYKRLFEKGLRFRLNSWVDEIRTTSVAGKNLYSAEPFAVEDVETVVLATAPRANAALYFMLKGKIENLHRIGDCVAPRKLDQAIYEGFVAGHELSAHERYIVMGELEAGQPLPPSANGAFRPLT